MHRNTLRKMALRPSERSVIHLLRTNGATSKAELARLSEMSAQGISVIVDRLLDLGLVEKGNKLRGRVGQPSTPISLSADGAMSIGIFIGRTEAEIAVADFTGAITQSMTVRYDDAADPVTPALLYRRVMEVTENSKDLTSQRCAGIGIAANEGLLKYFIDGPAGSRASSPLATQLRQILDVPVHGINDIRAACLAEITLGDTRAASNALYLSLGILFGSGIILEGRLIGNETNLSSGLHALPVAVAGGGVLGDFVALRPLSRAIAAAGYDFCEQKRQGFADTRQIFDDWRANAVAALTVAVRAASATVPLDSVIIESRLRDAELFLIINELREVLHGEAGWPGPLPQVVAGKFGPHARAIGTAMVPFYKMFGPPERDVSRRRIAKDVA